MITVRVGSLAGLTEARWFRWLRGGLFVLMGLVLFEAIVLTPLFHLQFESDTGLVLSGATAIRRCLHDGTLLRCPNVSRLPLLQYLPTVAAQMIGVDPVPVLAGLNVLATIGLVLTLMVVLRRGRMSLGAPMLAAAAWIGGYGIWYAHSTFAEALAAFLITFAVAACYRRRPMLTGIAMIFATMSKETAGPFLLAFGALALMLQPTNTSRSRGRTALAGVGGVLVGMICNAFFNVFRYGTPLNLGYLEAAYRVTDWTRRMEYFAAQWVSPNGGVLIFAPILCLVVMVVARSGTDDLIARWVMRMAVGTLFAMAMGFSLWYSPMGWWGYGSRYLMPWLPVTLMLALLTHGDAWRRWAQAIGPRRYLVLSIGLAIFALPHCIAVVDGTEYTRFFHLNPECRHITNVLTDPVGQMHAMRCLLFPRWYILPWRIVSHVPEYLGLAVSYITILVLLLRRAARSAQDPVYT